MGWQNKISQKNLSNILHCANMNQDSRVNVHFDNSTQCNENSLRQTSNFDIKLPTNIHLISVSKEHKLTEFLAADEFYKFCLKNKGYAMAADVLRLSCLKSTGRIYSDVDDRCLTPIMWKMLLLHQMKF
ncbi:MAG TPA: glycosyltransferase [Arsenophonus sp.]